VNPMSSYQGKPGYWISGATHGNEFTGSEVCLYIVDKLVSAYGNDEAITQLIDTKTFYICPMVNPDGVYNSVEKGISQRQNSMLLDDDNDGRINEDGWDDINGDGHITQFRYPSKTGRYVMDDEDRRVMVRLRTGQKTEKPRYDVVMEDIDNDKDGKTGEDPERGIDLNRNFPEGWAKVDNFAGGSGDYPTSAPETRALAEFFTTHSNILIGQNYHTSGGFTFRPMGTAPHPNLHPKDVAVLDFIMGKKYLEIIGEEVPEAWQKPDQLDVFKAELKKTSKNKYAVQRGYELPRGWRVSYNEAADKRYSYGMATDWMYMQQGVFAITTELWNPVKDIPGFPEVEGGRRDPAYMRELVKFQDANYGGKLFIPWKKFKHPELGDGEVGGFIPIYRNNAWPGEPLLKVCEEHWQFELFRAGLLPEVELGDVKAKVRYTTNSAKEATAAVKGDDVTIKKGGSKGKFKVVEVTAQVKNSGKLATHVARGARLAGLREDIIWLLGDRDKITYLQGTTWQRLGVLEGTMKIPGYKGGEMPPAASPQQQFRRRQIYPPGYPMPQSRFGGPRLSPTEVKGKGPTRTVKWLVAVEGDTPLKVVVSSQKGGTKVKNVRID
ncbi:MAG: hypothetical protein GQ544_03620, partial [Candidatus Aminicenantes bacterium]|nr:hypothetical protein [Candidatus Aminicenantes bacterium]